jgi:very-short-patch-repair endonuclease
MEDWKYDHYIEQIRRTFHQKKNKKGFRVKKHENYVITALLHDERLRELKPITQHYVPLSDSNYALIDLYYPQIDFAIEVDEPFHLDNKDADDKRQKRIEDLIQCDFKRFDVDEGKIISDIAKAKQQIIKKMEALKAKGAFEEWKPIETLDIDEAKKQYKNTLFIKIKGEFQPEQMYNRYRGRWPLAEKKLPHIKQVIVVHDRVISKVFKDPIFKRFEEDNKVYFEAEEDSQNEIIGNNITNWEYQITWTYSEDVEEAVKRKKK